MKIIETFRRLELTNVRKLEGVCDPAIDEDQINLIKSFIVEAQIDNIE